MCKSAKNTIVGVLLVIVCATSAVGEEKIEDLAATLATPVVNTVTTGVSQAELDATISQIKSELRSQRDLNELRLQVLENSIKNLSSYIERLLFAFMLAGGIVLFVVMVTINKQSGINNEKMRNLIRESENMLNDMHRMLDRPETEHFHVSRKLSRIMNKLREHDLVSLPQKEINDIYAASEDPTMPVALHLQANALKQEQAGDFRQAIILWERLLGIDNSSPEVLLHLAQNYKKLSETSTGQEVTTYRKASLEYFHQYSIKTSYHMNATNELQQRMGALASQLPKRLEQENEAQAAVTTLAPVAQKQPLQQQRHMTASMLGDSTSAAKPLLTKPAMIMPDDLLMQSVPAPKAQVQQQAAATASTSAPIASLRSNHANEVIRIKHKQQLMRDKKSATQVNTVMSQRSQDTSLFSTSNGKQQSVASVSTGNGTQVHPSARQQQTQLQAKQVATPKLLSANGKKLPAKPSKANKTKMSPEQREKSFSSRMSKAMEFFRRFPTAKPSEQLKLLNAAIIELEAAEGYKKNENLYRLWGTTLLEISRQGKGSKTEQVRQAINVFTKGEHDANGRFSSEIALCHAMINEEKECRKALEKAKDLGTLNLEIFNELPEEQRFQQHPWYQALTA